MWIIKLELPKIDEKDGNKEEGWDENEMADKSAYMSAGGYSSGYMGSNASSSGYAREDYASGGSGGGASNNQNQGGSGGNTNPGAQVFKARTDQSCYLGP
ncbi:unnamed protein product [Caenorhabditis brenneri]